jgi:hypothetical protein
MSAQINQPPGLLERATVLDGTKCGSEMVSMAFMTFANWDPMFKSECKTSFCIFMQNIPMKESH